MNILAVDTTSKKASVALLISEENKMFEKHIDNEITHSEKLMPLIDASLKEANINLKDIDLFACVLGPGSFTGIRIGVSTIKAFSKVFDTKIFAVDTLELMAYNISLEDLDKNEVVISMLNAKNDRLYYNVYEKASQKETVYFKPLLHSTCSNIDEMLEYINKTLDRKLTKISLVFSGYEEGSIETDKIIKSLKAYINKTLFSKDNISLILHLITKLNKNNKLFRNHIYTYMSLDAIYVNKSSAERIKYAK